VTLSNSTVNQDQIDVWISADYLARVEITSIVPEPEEVMVAGDRVVYRFNMDAQSEASMMRIALEPDDPGLSTGRIGVIDGPDLAFWQFVYP
jgi:hypothetical protein